MDKLSRKWPVFALLALLQLVSSVNPSQAQAEHGERDQRGNLSIRLHPFADHGGLGLVPSSGLAAEPSDELYAKDHKEFLAKAEALLYLHRENPLLTFKLELGVSPRSWGLKQSSQQSYSFAFGMVPLCDIALEAHRLADGVLAFLGTIPQIDRDELATPREDWPGQGALSSQISTLARLDLRKAYQLLGKERCYWVRDGNALPSWRLDLEQAGLLYRMIVDDNEIFSQMPRYFDLADPVMGKIQSYASNPLDSVLTIYDAEFSGSDNKLSSLYFQTNTNSFDTSLNRATSETYSFIFDPGDKRLGESAVFRNASTMYAFFQGLGYSWLGNNPLVLRVHAVISGNLNNALYEPSRGGLPSISIGEGDGTVLRNLELDRDVVSHEFTHHVIFSKVTSTSGESLVLHEGLADYFAFERGGNACLGESICPDNSPICVVPKHCLRSGENTLSYLSDVYRTLGAHQQGQVISGLLWNLRSKLGQDKILKTTYGSINYLPQDAGFSDFFTALLLANRDLYQGADACAIVDELNSRAFQAKLGNINCSDPTTFPAERSVGVSDSSEPKPPASTPAKKSKSLCGSLPVGHGAGGGSGTAAGGAMLVFSPLLLVALLLARRQRSR